MTYNALDNQTAAERLLEQLKLELQGLESTIAYEHNLQSGDRFPGEELDPEPTNNEWCALNINRLIKALRHYLNDDREAQ